VKHRLRRAVVTLALASAAVFAVTGLAAAPQSDTAWGAPATADDTAWGVPPVIDPPFVDPLDTAWG
jgi:hypothetical protein